MAKSKNKKASNGKSKPSIDNNKNGTTTPLAKTKKTSFLLGITMMVLIALMASAKVLVWDPLMQYENQFFHGKAEYLLMTSMSRGHKWLLRQLPILAPDAKMSLEIHPNGHTSTQEYYDPAKHDRPYRKLVTDVLNQTECAVIRNMLSRTTSRRQGVGFGVEDKSLDMEFSSKSVYRFLGVHEDDEVHTSHEEKALLRKLLQRIQVEAETAFKSSTMILEYSDVTLRHNPIPNDWAHWIQNWHYLSTGGHGLHADQCAIDISSRKSLEAGFACGLQENHCCAYRTHSILLYLNDLESQDLQGGDMYLVDRHDLLDESTPSFAGVGLAQQLQHVIRVKPSCGNLVLFASDTRNLHGTFPIQSGSRFAMPMWFTNPAHLPWHEEALLTTQLESFWRDFHFLCHSMGTDLAVPSGLQQYVGDCDAMLYAVQEMAGWWDEEEEDNDEEE